MIRSLAAAILLLTSVSAAAAAEPQKADQPEKSADSGDKLICKRFVETGSLVRANRVCKTKRDWERERDNLRSVNNSNSCANFGVTGSCG